MVNKGKPVIGGQAGRLSRRPLALALLTCALLWLAACRAPTERAPDEPALGSAPEPVPIENSGKTLAGNYVIKAVEDGYSKATAQADAVTTFNFSSDGTFKIERLALGLTTVVEEGSYLISTGNELVLYVEKAYGEPRSEARLERYPITEQRGESLRLQSYPSKVLVLQRQ